MVDKRCLGNGPFNAGRSHFTRFTGDASSKAIRIPGTACLILHPGSPNKLSECVRGPRLDECSILVEDEFYKDGKPPREHALKPHGCFWDFEEQERGMPESERQLYCNSGEDWGRIEKRHWVRVGDGDYEELE